RDAGRVDECAGEGRRAGGVGGDGDGADEGAALTRAGGVRGRAGEHLDLVLRVGRRLDAAGNGDVRAVDKGVGHKGRRLVVVRAGAQVDAERPVEIDAVMTDEIVVAAAGDVHAGAAVVLDGVAGRRGAATDDVSENRVEVDAGAGVAQRGGAVGADADDASSA